MSTKYLVDIGKGPKTWGETLQMEYFVESRQSLHGYGDFYPSDAINCLAAYLPAPSNQTEADQLSALITRRETRATPQGAPKASKIYLAAIAAISELGTYAGVPVTQRLFEAEQKIQSVMAQHLPGDKTSSSLCEKIAFSRKLMTTTNKIAERTKGWDTSFYDQTAKIKSLREQLAVQVAGMDWAAFFESFPKYDFPELRTAIAYAQVKGAVAHGQDAFELCDNGTIQLGNFNLGLAKPLEESRELQMELLTKLMWGYIKKNCG